MAGRMANAKRGRSWFTADEVTDEPPRGLSWMAGPGGGTLALGLSWRKALDGRILVALVAAAMIIAMVATPAAATPETGTTVSVIVRGTPDSGDAAAQLVKQHGGSLGVRLGIIDGFVAEVPAASLVAIAADPAVASVTRNGTVTMLKSGWESASTLGGLDVMTHPGSLYEITRETSARSMWTHGYTGAGIDIALIDTGVAPVPGLTASGKVINGPDLSFESQSPDLLYLDTYGHGTHLAGVMAGRDEAVVGSYSNAASDFFIGVAPDARIVNVKVGSRNGAVDVSQVIAAIDWVVQHRNDNGMNIRVLNLAFGTNSTQGYVLDPLAFAVEQAWHQGIVVVVAAGNDGNESHLRNPAYDPFVIAVGAKDGNATPEKQDDFVASFSNCGTSVRHVDLVAAGRSITSLRNPGSHADVTHPEARVAERFFVGSGTSQAAAVVAGAAALLLDQRPELSPDEVKALLTSTAKTLKGESGNCQGGGTIDLGAAMAAKTPRAGRAHQSWMPATGLGSIDAARGDAELSHDGVVLDGEQDIFGNSWDGASWSTLSAAGASWSGGDWNGASWSGASWSGASWSGASWSGASWSGASWSGASWSGASWSGASWSGASWSGASTTGASTTGASTTGASWSGASWSGGGLSANIAI